MVILLVFITFFVVMGVGTVIVFLFDNPTHKGAPYPETDTVDRNDNSVTISSDIHKVTNPDM